MVTLSDCECLELKGREGEGLPAPRFLVRYVGEPVAKAEK